MFIVKRTQREDISAVLRIAKQSGLSEWSQIDYENELERSDSIFLVASNGRQNVIGFAIGRVVPGAEANSDSAELYNISVSDEFRRRKVGSSLVNTFFEFCGERGVNDVFLEVRVSNDAAIEFYEKLGFMARYSRPAFYSNPTEDATVMRAII